MLITAERYHDFSYGHRVVGHEGHCKDLHGHNGRVTFTIAAEKLDEVGRVVDFGVIKSKLCDLVEKEWDHRMLIWENDPLIQNLSSEDIGSLYPGIRIVTFNPTAENLAEYLCTVVGPFALIETGAKLIRVKFEETRKCSATYDIIASDILDRPFDL